MILKIVKHCRDGLPDAVAGSLLGYERDDGAGNLSGVLEVSLETLSGGRAGVEPRPNRRGKK